MHTVNIDTRLSQTGNNKVKIYPEESTSKDKSFVKMKNKMYRYPEKSLNMSKTM
jgi:hypothetical protein